MDFVCACACVPHGLLPRYACLVYRLVSFGVVACLFVGMGVMTELVRCDVCA